VVYCIRVEFVQGIICVLRRMHRNANTEPSALEQ
jgi:hypothetical protein